MLPGNPALESRLHGAEISSLFGIFWLKPRAQNLRSGEDITQSILASRYFNQIPLLAVCLLLSTMQDMQAAMWLPSEKPRPCDMKAFDALQISERYIAEFIEPCISYIPKLFLSFNACLPYKYGTYVQCHGKQIK